MDQQCSAILKHYHLGCPQPKSSPINRLFNDRPLDA